MVLDITRVVFGDALADVDRWIDADSTNAIGSLSWSLSHNLRLSIARSAERSQVVGVRLLAVIPGRKLRFQVDLQVPPMQ
jgi:hypothetical protein